MGAPQLTQGQFLQFTLQVDTEVSAGMLQELNFGDIVSNALRRIDPNNPNSGWFQLVVLNASQLQIEFQTPEYLTLFSEPGCDEEWCRFPIELGFAYFVSGNPNDRGDGSTFALSPGVNFIDLPEISGAGENEDYIYVNVNVFGQIDVGEVNPGAYIGELLMEVSY